MAHAHTQTREIEKEPEVQSARASDPDMVSRVMEQHRTVARREPCMSKAYFFSGRTEGLFVSASAAAFGVEKWQRKQTTENR